MIWESAYWKDDLLRMARQIRRAMRQKRWSEASHANVEKCLLIGFYSIRRLLESKKLSDRIRDLTFKVESFHSRGRPVHFMNRHKVDELYDLGKSATVSIGLRELCNSFVHSYVLTPIHDERNGLKGILVSSDFRRGSQVLLIRAPTIAQLFEKVGQNYPTESHGVFDGKEWKFTLR
jgi:hypothetical protein